MSSDEIDSTGIKRMNVILTLTQEGMDHRKDMFKNLDSDAQVLKAEEVEVPTCSSRIHPMDLNFRGLKKTGLGSGVSGSNGRSGYKHKL